MTSLLFTNNTEIGQFIDECSIFDTSVNATDSYGYKSYQKWDGNKYFNYGKCEASQKNEKELNYLLLQQ